MKKVLGTIGNILYYGLFTLMIAAVISSLTAVMGNKQPEVFGHKFFVVMTGSMEPSISTGSLIIDKVVPADEIVVGDIISYQVNSDTIVTHRVMELSEVNGELGFITQGDANNTLDSVPVKASQVIGVVTSTIPGVGSFIIWIKDNFIYLLGLLVAILLTTAIYDGVNVYYNKKKKKEIATNENLEINNEI